MCNNTLHNIHEECVIRRDLYSMSLGQDDIILVFYFLAGQSQKRLVIRLNLYFQTYLFLRISKGYFSVNSKCVQ